MVGKKKKKGICEIILTKITGRYPVSFGGVGKDWECLLGDSPAGKAGSFQKI